MFQIKWYVAGVVLLMLVICYLGVIAPLFITPTILGSWYSSASGAEVQFREDGTLTWFYQEGRWEVEDDVLVYTPYAPATGNLYGRFRIDELTNGLLVLERLPVTDPPRYLAFGRLAPP